VHALLGAAKLLTQRHVWFILTEFNPALQASTAKEVGTNVSVNRSVCLGTYGDCPDVLWHSASNSYCKLLAHLLAQL
jgi:hypothetical protein